MIHRTLSTTRYLLPALLLVILVTPVMAGEPILTPQAEGVFRDALSGKEWQMKRSGRIRESREAQAFLARLNGQQGGGWRLPTKEDLYQLMNRFDLKENGEVKIPIEGKYWLSDEGGKIYVGAWEIGDGCGPNRQFYTGDAGYVRAVRP